MSTISGMGGSLNMMTQIMTKQRPDKQQMFKNIDTDASGLVEQTELSSFVDQFASNMGIEINAEDALTSYDANADGGLSQEEMEAMLSAYMPAPPDMSAVGGGFGGGGMTGVSMPPPPPPPQDAEEMFSNIDTDSSGTIDESELTTFVNDLTEKTGIEIDIDEVLSTYDKDGDKALSQEELETMVAASMTPPPPPPAFQVAAAYNSQTRDTGNRETISQMISSLNTVSTANDQSVIYTPFNITA